VSLTTAARTPPIHVFIDNSNVFGGAAECAKLLEPQVPWVAVRVYFRNLFALIEKGRPKLTAVLGGSVPRGNEGLWDYARQQGYSTDLLRRLDNADGTTEEQAVDEVLHLKIANALLDHDPPQTLVLVTGDGSESDFGTGFAKQVDRALKRGWDVEVYSWRAGLSGVFGRQAASSNGKMKVFELDSNYHSLTFVKAGRYFVTTDGGLKVDVDIGERIVSPLR